MISENFFDVSASSSMKLIHASRRLQWLRFLAKLRDGAMRQIEAFAVTPLSK